MLLFPKATNLSISIYVNFQLGAQISPARNLSAKHKTRETPVIVSYRQAIFCVQLSAIFSFLFRYNDDRRRVVLWNALDDESSARSLWRRKERQRKREEEKREKYVFSEQSGAPAPAIVSSASTTTVNRRAAATQPPGAGSTLDFSCDYY